MHSHTPSVDLRTNTAVMSKHTMRNAAPKPDSAALQICECLHVYCRADQVQLSFKMETRVAMATVAAAVAILALLGYSVIYPYVAFTVTIKNSISTDPSFAHLDLIPVGTPSHPDLIPVGTPTDSFFMKEISHNELDDSLTITFNGTYVDGSGRSKFFEYVNSYPVNSTFAFRCVEDPDITYLGFYKYLGTTDAEGRTYIQFWHYDAETRGPMPCVYPEVLAYSVNVRAPQQAPPGPDRPAGQP